MYTFPYYIYYKGCEIVIHNQDNFIVFKGFNTKGIFLIEELPIVPTANVKQDIIEIDGRHGFLTNSQESYEPIDIDIELKIYNKKDIQKVRNIFRGSGQLILSNQPDRYYKATVVSKLDFERVIRQFHTVLVTFKLQPHAYETKDSTIKLTSASTSYGLENNTNATAQPEITIYGTGTATLIIGNETIRIKDINNHIILNYDLKEAYRINDGIMSNANKDVECDYVEIQTGTTLISWSGSGITGIEINPNWRWL